MHGYQYIHAPLISRNVLKVYPLIAVLFFPLALLNCTSKPGEVFKPNFIIILTDDQQYDAVGINGNNAIMTPSIDRLAQQSIRFTGANVVFSLCSPSRAAILTGRYGSANGVLELNSHLNPGEQTIAQYLKTVGYTTGMSGKWHLPTPPDSLGFDFYNYFFGNGTYYGRKINDLGKTIRPVIHCDAYCARRSIDFLHQQVTAGHPFFLFHCTQAPHMDHQHTWPAQDSTKSMYSVGEMPVPLNHRDDLTGKPQYLKTVRNRTQALLYGYPDSIAIQTHTRDYYAVITELDDVISQLLNTVDQLNIADHTYIIFLSDNGWMLGDHGFTSKVLPYRPSTSVPFFIRGPGISSNTNNSLVSNIDIAPTILDLAGVTVPSKIHGQSLKPLLMNEEFNPRKMMLYEGMGLYGGAKPNLTVISADFRYIVTYDDESLENITFEELYDQNNDHWEMKNLAHEPNYTDVIESMKSVIDNHKVNVLTHSSIEN